MRAGQQRQQGQLFIQTGSNSCLERPKIVHSNDYGVETIKTDTMR